MNRQRPRIGTISSNYFEDLGKNWLDQIRCVLVAVCTEHALFVRS